MRTPAVFVVAVAVACVGGCSKCASPESGAPADADGVDDGGFSPPPRPVSPDTEAACTGSRIDLAKVVVDPRCAIRSAAAKALRAAFEADAGAKAGLRQEASRTEDGSVELRLVNGGPSPLALPLSWHPKIAAFVVFADSPKEKAVYELAAPKLDVPGQERDGGVAHFARITLASGGAAFARLAIDPTIARRLDPPCLEDGATCAPPRLAPGTWSLHVGQLITDVETGAPARLAWEIR